MKTTALSIQNMKTEILRYLDRGKYRLSFKIVLLLLSAIMIYSAGKSLGEIIYHILN
ncbi:secreted protein [Christiangramia forsetii KT0803]|uniref:Secreted protein n=1 Tax=Christiangramia forsetii (strain DSM 17595 / CGMCC 1.15422 / KT0803) TaxID=411154 RepID=A0LXM4_CHRFK|nr:secreted protein [Christiangramia forsetii KT0803]